jgi:general secretion pathway protein K
VLVERMMPYVTVFSGRAQVNVLDAEPLVLAALPGVTPESLQAMLEARALPQVDRKSLPSLLGATQGLANTESGKAVRIGVVIDFDNGRRSGADAVILLPDDRSDPYRVLSWRYAYDGVTDQPVDFGRR